MSLADLQWCPTSVQVTVLQARGLRIKGKSGTNDAYALMQVGKEKFQTAVVEKSVAPMWKEEAAFDLPGGGTERCTLHVQVLHRALMGPDKLLGQVIINLLQLTEDKTRNKTEWFKLLDKTGKADKDRGEVLVDIQFMRHNMTASMFDLSTAGKSRSRLGKFKDKVRGKKRESDTASNVVPSFTQVLTDSEEEGKQDAEEDADKGEKKKKNKKSLFSTKSNLQRNLSQSMSVLPAKNSSLSGSQSSGLNMDSSEGKKKFKFLMHKRSGSSDSKDSSSGNQKHGAVEESNVCINGSHVYCEEKPPRTSRIGSNFSLASSGHGSMEDVPESSTSVDSLRAVRKYSPWTEEEEEEEEEGELIKEDVSELRREEGERIRRQEEELERLAEEKRQREEEKRTKEEKVKREERIKRQEEERAQEMRRQQEERVRREERERLAKEKKRLEEQEEEKVRKEEEERIRREERVEEERRQEEHEEKRRLEEQRRQREEEERIRIEEETAQEERRRKEVERAKRQEERKLAEEKRRMEEEERIEKERVRQEEEERIWNELAEEKRRQEEMERIQKEEREEKRRLEEQERRQREEEERIRIEEMAQEERRHKEVERAKRQEERKLAEEKRRLEEEERIEKERVRKEEEERIRRELEMAEEERRREEMVRIQKEQREQRRRLEEQERWQREERIRIEEEMAQEERRHKEVERAKRQEQERKLAEEKRRMEEEERFEKERVRKEEEERIRRELAMAEEERRREEEEMVRIQKEEREEKRRLEEQRRRREEEEKIKKAEEEKARREKEDYERLVEKMKLEEEERKRIEAEKMRQEERIRVEEEMRKKEEETVKRQEEHEKSAEIKKTKEQERRRIEEEKREEEERIRMKGRQEEEEIARKKKEEHERVVEEKNRQEEQERRWIGEEEKIKKKEEERIRIKKEAEEEARKLEVEKLKREAEKQKDNQTAVAVESPAGIPPNPFDENLSNNPFEKIPDSPAGLANNTAKVSTIQQRVQSAASLVGSEPVSTDEKSPISTQQERRLAPQPPGRNPAERQAQGEQHESTPNPTQINKKSKDKDIKTVSVLPQRSVQMIAPLSIAPPPDTKYTQSMTPSSSTIKTSNGAKHSKRPAPSRPRSVEGSSSEHNTALSSDGDLSHECVSEGKPFPIVYGLNPFEDDEDEIVAQDDVTISGNTGSVQWPPVVSQAADKDVASQVKIKSSKARAPPLPVTKPDNCACDPKSEAIRPVHVQEAPLQESQPVAVQSAREEAGGKKEGSPITSRRLQPVKPLNPVKQQSVPIVQGKNDNKSTGILCQVQEKTKVKDTGLTGPYSQLTQEELISLLLKQETQLSEKATKISELEQYIDNLLVRIIEEKPSILMSLNSLKKAA